MGREGGEHVQRAADGGGDAFELQHQTVAHALDQPAAVLGQQSGHDLVNEGLPAPHRAFFVVCDQPDGLDQVDHHDRAGHAAKQGP